MEREKGLGGMKKGRKVDRSCPWLGARARSVKKEAIRVAASELYDKLRGGERFSPGGAGEMKN